MLRLRQKIDGILDSMELSFLHIERGYGKNPVLVTECGKEIINIFGILLPTSLASKERDYAVELIERYLYTNEDDLRWLIEQKKNPIDLNKLTNFDISVRNISSKRWRKNTWVYDNPEYTITLNFKDKKGNVSMTVDEHHLPRYWKYTFSDCSAEEIASFIDTQDAHLAAIKEYATEWKKKQKVDSKIQELSECKI